LNPSVPNPNHVFVIDDSEPIHKLIAVRLRPEGLEVTGELSGERGIQRAIEVKPDLILLDVELPDLDGFEVCRQLKEHPATRAIPVIFLTGTRSTDSKVRGLDLGAVDYVTKPFDQVELRARVRAALRTKRLQDILEHQSFLDGLTGLWNRAYFDRRIESEMNIARRYQRPLSIVLSDIDRFKNVNDTYGHLFGDVVLQGVSECLRAGARRSDVVTRYGGEEFALILIDTDLPAALAVAERLRASVEAQGYEAHGKQITTSASFGATCSNEGGEPTAQTLIDNADKALYGAKDGGRNCVYACTRGRIVHSDEVEPSPVSGVQARSRDT